MTKIKLFGILITFFFVACSDSSEETKSIKNVSFSGFTSNYLKITDNSKTDNSVIISFELSKKPNEEVCKKTHGETLIGKFLNTDSSDFTPTASEMGKLVKLLNNGKVGDKIQVAFSSKENLTAKSANSFKIIDAAFQFCEKEPVAKPQSAADSKISDAIGTAKDWDQIIKDYEHAIDLYIAAKKKAKTNGTSMNGYPSILKKSKDLNKKMATASNIITASQRKKIMKLQGKLAKALRNK